MVSGRFPAGGAAPAVDLAAAGPGSAAAAMLEPHPALLSVAGSAAQRICAAPLLPPADQQQRE